jgi:hypothetical protein
VVDDARFLKLVKTTEKTNKAKIPAPRKALVLEPNELLLAAPRNKTLIRWPKERQLQAVSVRLARIAKTGMRAEAKGDYFNSGDLAYQIQQIIEATDELFKKSQRLQR